MDYRQPVQALIPGARGRILAVLAHTESELPLSRLGRLARVSVNQVPRVVDHLAALGLVTTRSVPPSTLVALERRNLASRLVVQLAELDSAAFHHLAELARELRPAPHSVVVFGSFASGAAGIESDVDVAIVHDEASLGSEEWAASLADFVHLGSVALGNTVSITELTIEDIQRGALATDFWSEVRATHVRLVGPPIDEVAA